MAQEPTRTSPQNGNGLSREILVVGGVIVLGAIMSILDATIINVASPRSAAASTRRSARFSG